MEILLSFLCGAVFSAAIAFLVSKSVVKNRVMQAEAEGKAEQARLKADLNSANMRLNDARERMEKEKTEAEARLELTKKEMSDTRDEALKAMQARFDETIEKMSAQVKTTTEDMLKRRQEEFSQTSGKSIESLMTPLKDNIAELRKAMDSGSKELAARDGQMREQIKNLMDHSEAARKSADDLAAAFKHGSKVQGDWGETILEELLASQGLTRGVHFETQAVIRDAAGRPVHADTGGTFRPDVILHLDERREVIIDSKVSLTAYVDYVNAENEADRRDFLKKHVESLRKHVKELAEKDYASYVQPPKVSAGYVIMFVPNSGALWTAMNAEPDLWRKAADMNVYIADEQTLFAALKIVRLTWTQVAQAQNHEKVYELANEMLERVGVFMEKYEAVGTALKKAENAYNEGMRKLDVKGQSIINTSSKLLKLGAKNSVKHPLQALIDVDDIPALPDTRAPSSTSGSEREDDTRTL